jgi:hypothetical protein
MPNVVCDQEARYSPIHLNDVAMNGLSTHGPGVVLGLMIVENL